MVTGIESVSSKKNPFEMESKQPQLQETSGTVANLFEDDPFKKEKDVVKPLFGETTGTLAQESEGFAMTA